MRPTYCERKSRSCQPQYNPCVPYCPPSPPPARAPVLSHAYLSTIAPDPSPQFIVIAPQTETSLGTLVTFGQNGGNILLQGEWGIPPSADGTTLLVGETGTYQINIQGSFQEAAPLGRPTYGLVSIFMTLNGNNLQSVVRDSVATSSTVSTSLNLRNITAASSNFILPLAQGSLLRFWAVRLASQEAQEMVASSISVLDTPPLNTPGDYQQPWYRVSIVKIA